MVSCVSNLVCHRMRNTGRVRGTGGPCAYCRVGLMNPKTDRLINRGWRQWVALYALWTVPAVFSASTTALSQYNAANPIPWYTAFYHSIWFFYFWAAACPLIYRLAIRFRCPGKSHLRALASHTAASLVAVVAMSLLLCVLNYFLFTRDESLVELLRAEVTTPKALMRHITTIFFYWITLGAMTFIRMGRVRKQKEHEAAAITLRASQLEAQLNSAKLTMLRMQLHPHFLFNALNSVASLIENKKNNLAYRTVGLLGSLLRTTLEHANNHKVTLQEELNYINRYLEIEQLRFPDRLHVEYDVASECREALVPTLILQPLVENVISHAINKKPEAGLIQIRVYRENGYLAMEVHDDGPGLHEGWSFDRDARVGLNNVWERLRVLYGREYQFDIITSDPCGVTSRVAIPFTCTKEPADA